MAADGLITRSSVAAAALARGDTLLETDPAAAASHARNLLRSDPRNPAAHRFLAKAMARLGRDDQARIARARSVQLSRQVPAIAKAHAAATNGRFHDVEPLLRDHLARYPDDPVALTIRGQALAHIGRFNEAVRDLDAALAFMPEYPEAGVARVRVHRERFDLPAALAALEPLLETRPADAGLLRWKASLLSNFGRNAAAADILRGLLEAHPDKAELWIGYGDELRTLGQSEQAYAAYRRAVDVNRSFGAAWWSLAALGYAPFDETDRERMQAAMESSPDDDNRRFLHFALGAALDKAKMHEQAFENFAAGNALRHRQTPFDAAAIHNEVERTRRLLTAGFFAERAGSGSPSPDPIFIVSLPRAGSTLVEQVLASHPQIEGTAELPFIPILIRTLAAENGIDLDGSYRELLPRLDPSVFAPIGEEYLRLTKSHRRTDRPYFLDKLPHNWADIGFIKLILPNARIIDVRRSPMDCCWSNFRLLFAKGHPASNSLEGIAAYYRHYVEMMAHWDAALPGQVHRVIYEQLVDNFEPEVRRLLDYLELPFEPAVLDFHATERAVATASAEQVRRPLNRRGIGAWRPYEPWLGPLKDALGDLEQTYDR